MIDAKMAFGLRLPTAAEARTCERECTAVVIAALESIRKGFRGHRQRLNGLSGNAHMTRLRPSFAICNERLVDILVNGLPDIRAARESHRSRLSGGAGDLHGYHHNATGGQRL